MHEDNFDIDSLAAYLHLLPQQVDRLAYRGRLPGRKVAGQWRFSRAEIHHWMEQRIGISSDDELAHMENVLGEGATEPQPETIVLADWLAVEAVAVPLSARTRGSVIAEMTALAAGTGLLWDAGKMAEAVRARESMHPTALECGVALLHPRRPMPSILGQTLLAMGVTARGIPFGDRRGNLTDVFFLICSLDDQSHLRVLARLSRLIAQTDFLSDLRTASSGQEAHGLVSRYEADIE